MMEWINSLTENESNAILAVGLIVAFVSLIGLLPDFGGFDD